jgi:hypothetical protein
VLIKTKKTKNKKQKTRKEKEKKKCFLSQIIPRTISASITLGPFLASQLLPGSEYGGVLPHVLHKITLIGANWANYAIKA